FLFEVGKSLGISQLMKVLLFGFLYHIGVIQLKSALKRIFNSLRGIKIERLIQVAEKVPVVPNAKEVFSQLRTQGCKTALISSGMPKIVVRRLAAKLGADYGFGFDIGVNNEELTGEIWGEVIEQNGKLQVLSQILKTEGLSLSDCVVVADDRNNAPIFLREIQKIGYNPDFLMRIKADNVVTGQLSKILPVINGKPKLRALPSRNDVLREIIHASGFFVPVLCSFIGVPAVALMICIVVALYIISELLRMDGKNLLFISTVTHHAASQAELYEFAATPIYFAVGILLALLLFPPPISSAAIAIFALGDSTASIFGGLVSKRPLPFNKTKTLEGSLAGFFFAFLAGSFFISPLKALVGAAVAMIVEYLPLPVNDNILVPLCTGLTLMLIV
ncbi:MAG TPA: HAD-IB family phosphatase, partial [Candidatus Bathyarchaeia archaeon]|nr:HAD-IB family phosphatase [Candidatus Bathyarchaeia archaeon]